MSVISILIPVFNAEKYIGLAIESVLRQTYSDWELIILDDCSTDRSFEIAVKYSHENKRIKVFKNDFNLGMLENWNKGISLCTSPFFIKLDADDVWHPDILIRSLDVLSSYPDVALVFTKYINIDNAGNSIAGSEKELPDFACDKAFSCIPLVKLGPSKMLSFPILRQGLSLMRRKVFDEIGAYAHLLTKETQASTDTEFYFRVGCHHQLYCINQTLYYYRIHDTSISHSDKVKKLNEKKIFEVKMVINEYYFQQNRISRHEWRSNKREIKFYHRLFLTNEYRVEGNLIKFLSNLTGNLLEMPLRTLGFYFGRLFGNRVNELQHIDTAA